MDTWFQTKGFTKNPFSLDPVGTSDMALKAFANRVRERAVLENFLQQDTGAIMVAAAIGIGKSSFLNLAENYARKRKKMVLRIDPRIVKQDVSMLVSCMISELEREIVHVTDETLRVSGLSILAKLKIDSLGAAEIRPAIQELNTFFEARPCVMIMDDVDKFSLKKHTRFLKEMLDLLPSKLQVITTADLNQLITSPGLVKVVYDMFDFILPLDSANTIEKLREFIDSRMVNYSVDGVKIKIEDDLLMILIDRTQGNLREIYRYLTDLLKRNNIDRVNLLEVMVELDDLRIRSLDTVNKKILLSLSGKEIDLSEITLQYPEMNQSTLRFRLDNLTQLGLIFKDKEENSNKTIYSAPNVFKEYPSWSRDQVKV